jgi:hypothetical protein
VRAPFLALRDELDAGFQDLVRRIVAMKGGAS